MPPAEAVRRSFEELPDATRSTVALRQPNFDGYAGRLSAALNICDTCADRADLAATDLVDVGNQSGDFKFSSFRRNGRRNHPTSTGDVTSRSGPRCIRASRGPSSSSCEGYLVRTSCLSRSESAWPSRPGPAEMFRLLAAQCRLAAAVHLDPRRDLAIEQGQCFVPGGVMLLTKCEPADVCVRVNCAVVSTI
jgi:hypothetical protein